MSRSEELCMTYTVSRLSETAKHSGGLEKLTKALQEKKHRVHALSISFF